MGTGGAATCQGQGADTVGAYNNFFRLGNLAGIASTTTAVGDVVILYRSLEFEFAQSGLDTTKVALYRGMYGDTLVEFATGMSANARFAYRTGDTTYAPSVSSGSMSTIDGIRVFAIAEGPAASPSARRCTWRRPSATTR